MSVESSVIAEHVVLLTIDSAAALDRRSLSDGEELRDALLTAADDDSVKAIVLTGLTGEAGEVVSPEDAEPHARAVYSGTRGLHQVLTYCKKFVVAEVDGRCGPTASALCLAADFVVATPDSAFASPFDVAETNYPLAVLTMRANRTRTWMFRAADLTAAEAFEAGFVNQIEPARTLRDATTALARRSALMPLDGITVSKMNVGATFDVIGVGSEFDAVEASVAAGGIPW